MEAFRKVLRWFLSGLVILLPLAATLVLVGWALNVIDQLVGGQSVFALFWKTFFGWFSIPDVLAIFIGYIVLLTVTIVVGYFAQGFARQKIGAALRGFFDKIPILNKIYHSVEQVIDLWSKKQSGEDMTAIGEVVMVQFANVKVFGVLSSRNLYTMNGEEHYLVYLPSAPIPATGFTYFFKKDEVHICEGLKMDDMTKVVVSLGVLGEEVMGKEVILKGVPAKTVPAPPQAVSAPVAVTAPPVPAAKSPSADPEKKA